MTTESQRTYRSFSSEPIHLEPSFPKSMSNDMSRYFLDHSDTLHRGTTSPSSPMPDLVPRLTPEQKKDAKRRQKEQLGALYLQQKHHPSSSSSHIPHQKLDRHQAKLEQRQKKAEYIQMYQSQNDYLAEIEARSSQKRQQLSLPVYTGDRTTRDHPWDPAPTAEVYYHANRHYSHRLPKSRDIHQQHQYHSASFSSSSSDSFNSTLSPRTQHSFSHFSAAIDNGKARSMSLKSATTKSMHDLRPLSTMPQSPTFDYYAYDSDDTTSPRGGDSLKDTLHSPTASAEFPGTHSTSTSISTIHEPYGTSSTSSGATLNQADPDLDLLVDTAINALALSKDSLANGNGKYMLVLGANGRTGIELVKQGLERNYRVTAFVRDDKLLIEDLMLRKNQNLLIVRGSPTCQADLDRCVEGQDVVVNVIGARFMSSDTTICSHAQVVLNNAMKKHGVRRLVAVTSYGCLGLRNYLISTKRLFSRVFMTSILKDKVLQEDIIQRDSTHLDWTIVRPITLKDGDLTEKYIVTSEALPRTENRIKILTRKNLAHYILSIINDSDQYHAIRSIAGKPKPFKANPFCPLERRREAAEQALFRREEQIEKQLLEKKHHQLLEKIKSEYRTQQGPTSPSSPKLFNYPLPPFSPRSQ
ncbi:hypothetical protein BGZ94_009948 [Podila epigama]|nr:hypothetical protein BGZ94_009948 [Podila epigama]